MDQALENVHDPIIYLAAFDWDREDGFAVVVVHDENRVASSCDSFNLDASKPVFVYNVEPQEAMVDTYRRHPTLAAFQIIGRPAPA